MHWFQIVSRRLIEKINSIWNARAMCLYLLFLIPNCLFAGFLSWFYTSPETVAEFNCPYRCGKAGSQGVVEVEWKALIVMWELDQLGYALNEKEFPYSKFSRSINDPWLSALFARGIDVRCSLEIPEVMGMTSLPFRPTWFNNRRGESEYFSKTFCVHHPFLFKDFICLGIGLDVAEDEDEDHFRLTSSLKKIKKFSTMLSILGEQNPPKISAQ